MPSAQNDSLHISGSDSLAQASLTATRMPDPASFEPPGGFAPADSVFPTVMFDSIAADTLPGLPHFAPASVRDSLATQAILDSLAAHPTLRPSNAHIGLQPQPLTPHYSHSTPLTALMVGALVCAALDAKGIARTLAVYRNALWSVRRRRNAFDESHISSLPAQIILAAVFVIFGGVTLYNLPALPSPSVFSGAAKAMGLLGAYYIFQLIIYNLTGYAFSDSTGRKQWVQGFAAAQAIAGLGLIVPALLLVEMPQWHNVLIILALAIYFATRIIFIAKGFRIFYRNSWSVLYFILYLCSLEIIPPVGIYFFMKNILSGT